MQIIPHDNLGRLRVGERLAIEVQPSQPGTREWIGIHPFKFDITELSIDEDPPTEKEATKLPWRYTIRRFAVDRPFDFHKYDLHPEYITDYFLKETDSAESVLQILRDEFDITDANILKYPWDCDYPL